MKSSLTIIFTLFFGFLSAQTPKVASTSYQAVLKTLLSHSVPALSVKEAFNQKNTVMLDAREKREFDVSHLPNAIWVGYEKLDLSSVEKFDKNKPIIVYCSVGYRSEKVAEKLIKKGFTNVKNLYGGIFEWKNEGQELINQKGRTNDVHAYNKTWGIWLNKGNKIYE